MNTSLRSREGQTWASPPSENSTDKVVDMSTTPVQNAVSMLILANDLINIIVEFRKALKKYNDDKDLNKMSALISRKATTEFCTLYRINTSELDQMSSEGIEKRITLLAEFTELFRNIVIQNFQNLVKQLTSSPPRIQKQGFISTDHQIIDGKQEIPTVKQQNIVTEFQLISNKKDEINLKRITEKSAQNSIPAKPNYFDSGNNYSVISDKSHIDNNTSISLTFSEDGLETAGGAILPIEGAGIMHDLPAIYVPESIASLTSVSQFNRERERRN